MAANPSTMVELGREAPDFHLPDVADGKMVSLSDFASNRVLLVMFVCRHCPYVLHVKTELARLGRDYARKNVGIVGISSNDAQNYPDESPDTPADVSRSIGFMTLSHATTTLSTPPPLA